MQLARVQEQDGTVAVAVLQHHQTDGNTRGDHAILLPGQEGSLSAILASEQPRAMVEALISASSRSLPFAELIWLPPIDRQEVWAAGVTYKRSQVARMEESEQAASFYDLVYTASRPELFFKANPWRVSGQGQPLRIRHDSKWSVPEPELTLVLSPELRLVGYTIGNDMSARDIEGENPLYLPQAKTYDRCAGLGPAITLVDAMPPVEEVTIQLEIHRQGRVAFQGSTPLTQMHRTFDDLIGWLGRETTFPDGVFLMTGTGIVPPNDFTLQHGDMVSITITGIGTLTNPIEVKPPV